eukprot:c13730_g1_i1 orf=242-517(-)
MLLQLTSLQPPYFLRTYTTIYKKKHISESVCLNSRVSCSQKQKAHPILMQSCNRCKATASTYATDCLLRFSFSCRTAICEANSLRTKADQF